MVNMGSKTASSSYSASTIPSANLDKTYSLGEQLLNETNTAYNDLISAGLVNDALTLREATDRFARAGSQQGVNSFTRQQLANDMKIKLNAAAQKTQGELAASRVSQQNAIVNTLAGLSQAQFQAAAESARIGLQDRQLTQQNQQFQSGQAEGARQFDTSIKQQEAQRKAQLGAVQAQAMASIPSGNSRGFTLGNNARNEGFSSGSPSSTPQHNLTMSPVSWQKAQGFMSNRAGKGMDYIPSIGWVSQESISGKRPTPMDNYRPMGFTR